MYSVCLNCNEWEPNKEVRPLADNSAQALVICPECGHEHPFVYLPLFAICGPSAVGKSTVCAAMVGSATKSARDLVVLDSDILWGVAYTEPEEWPRYMDMWLRVCHNIHQSRRSVLLLGAGLNPGNLEERPARRYFSAIHYLGLVCDEDELIARLRARPGWRESSAAEFVQGQVDYNRWIIEQAQNDESPITAVNTSGVSVEEVAGEIGQWIQRFLSS